jgi:hypothetical protein
MEGKGKLPYFPFFPDDWLSDEKLRLCSLAARGLWMDLLSLMHKGDRRGFLQQANGSPYTPEQIARCAGCSLVEAAHLLQELLTTGTATADEHGVIYNRRMVRDERKRRLCSEAGRKGGGNPTFKGKRKGHPKGRPKGHSESESGFDSESSSGKRVGVQGEGEGFAEFWQAYPRKQAKQAAQKAWGNLAPDPELRRLILVGLEHAKRSRQWSEGVIPHPATWINGRRWEDEIQTGAQQPGFFNGLQEFVQGGASSDPERVRRSNGLPQLGSQQADPADPGGGLL